MLFASKIVCSGIVFLLMTPWTSGPHPLPLDSGPISAANWWRIMVGLESAGGSAGEQCQGDAADLQDEGHYRGKIDGMFGLRTRASIRGFQKAEHLPVTGQLDVQTASKLGVRPESRGDTGDETQDKPSAGITWAEGSRRSGRTLQKPAKK